MALKDYIVQEVALDCEEGLLSRREALRRLALMGISGAAAATLLAACGDDEAGSAATGPSDTGTADTAPPDTGPPDSGPPPTAASTTPPTTAAAAPGTESTDTAGSVHAADR